MTIGGKSTGGGTLRKVLLLAALCMALALVLSAPAIAQSASADPCPDPNFPRETPDGCQASDLPDVEFGSDATASPSSTASPSAGREGDPCGSFVIGSPEADECYRSFGLEPLEPGDASPTASPTASATASASASPSVSALPETGGPVSVLALGSLALLVVSGIMAFGIVRRS